MKCKISQKEVKGVTNKGLLIKGVSQTIENETREQRAEKLFYSFIFILLFWQYCLILLVRTLSCRLILVLDFSHNRSYCLLFIILTNKEWAFCSTVKVGHWVFLYIHSVMLVLFQT